MPDFEEIYNAYRDAASWLEAADEKIKKIKKTDGNKKLIKSALEQNKLMILIAQELAHLFEAIQEVGEESAADTYEETIPSEEIKKYLKGRMFFR